MASEGTGERTDGPGTTHRDPGAAAAAAEAALVAAGVSPQARGEALTVEEFAAIAENRADADAVDTAQHAQHTEESRPS